MRGRGIMSWKLTRKGITDENDGWGLGGARAKMQWEKLA